MSNTTNDHAYNLMTQLIEENRSLWRIEKYYQENRENCDDCGELWQDMIKVKSDWIKQLEKLSAKHLSE